MAVKVPPLLHKMSMAAQKAWYKKHGMEMPKAETGRSAAQAKKDVGEINKKKAREASIAAAVATSKKNKELVSSSERVRMMRKNADMFGGGLGGGLDRNRDIISYVRAGGTIKAGRLGEAVVKTKQVNKEKLKNYVRGLGTKAVIAGKVPFDQVNSPLRAGRKVLKQEEKKPDASMAMTHQLKMKMISDKDKRTLGKVAALMATQKKKMKEEVQIDEVTKQEAEKMLGGPVKTRTGTEPKGKLPLGFRAARNLARKAMKAGAPVNETGEYNALGQPPEHAAYLDVDPTRSDPLSKPVKKKPAQYKPGMKDGVRVRESAEVNEMKKGKLLAKAIMAKQSKHPISQYMGEAIKDAADVGEYDYEGDMAKSQLRSILANAKRLHDMLEDQDNLPEWVQSKITLAQDYIMTAADYMEGEMNEEVEQTDEAVRVVDRFYPGTPHDPQKRKDVAATVRKIRKDPDARGGMTGFNRYQDFFGGGKARLGAERTPVGEEVVTEAEGKVAVTPKEKELAAHHGDKSKITYGDVIKARIKSAAEKAMKKGN